MLRKVLRPIILVCILLLSVGCSVTNSEELTNSNSSAVRERDETESSAATHEESIQVMLDIRSFSEFMGESNCVAIGEYVSCRELDKNMEYEFKVKQVLKGDILEKVIHVLQMKGYASVATSTIGLNTGEKIYEEGEEYILVMGKEDYVFHDTPEYRLFIGAPYLPVKNLEKSTLYGEPIPDFAEDCSLEHIIKLIEQAEDITEGMGYSFRYSVAMDIPTVVKEADVVVRVKILRVLSDVADDRTTYLCSVQKTLKDDSVGELEGREDIYAILLKSSAKVGEEYMLLLNRGTTFFLASSKNSVFIATDEKAVKEIEEAVQKFQELNK